MTTTALSKVLADMAFNASEESPQSTGWKLASEHWKAKIESALASAEPVAWIVTGGRIFQDRLLLSKGSAEPTPESDYPECSGDPASCPENEGHGCCKPNPVKTPASVPDGYVMAPHFRGFAHLGLGQYRLFHSRAGSDAELSIVPATPDETAGRVVGDLRDDGPDEIPAELMAVRLRFENVAGLDALEQQLRLLRETHFSAPPTNQEGTTPCWPDK